MHTAETYEKEIQEEADSNKEWNNGVTVPENDDPDIEEVQEFEILSYPADTTLKGYLDQWNNKQLEVPEFQRGYVWDDKRASKLIESFLLGLPVPQVFLFKERSKQPYQIIDGLQRITSIVRFLKNEYKLKNVAKRWEGKKFNDLNEEDRLKLERIVMRSTIILQQNPDNHTSVYYIFERLNTGGVILNPMEVRMCVAEGEFTKMLKELNSVPIWREIIGMPKEDKRIRDIELLLRAFAFIEDSRNYRKPLKGFLNTYIDKVSKIRYKEVDEEKTRKISFEEANEKKETLLRCLEKAKRLGEKPFHLKGKLNAAVMDAVLFGLAHTQLNDTDDLKEKYKLLIDNSNFNDLVTASHTSDTKNVTARLELAKQIFTA